MKVVCPVHGVVSTVKIPAYTLDTVDGITPQRHGFDGIWLYVEIPVHDNLIEDNIRVDGPQTKDTEYDWVEIMQTLFGEIRAGNEDINSHFSCPDDHEEIPELRLEWNAAGGI